MIDEKKLIEEFEKLVVLRTDVYGEEKEEIAFNYSDIKNIVNNIPETGEYAQAKGKDIMLQEEYEMDEPEEAELLNFSNWIEVTEGIYKYALTKDSSYEIHVLHHSEGRDMMEAKASLYITGYWRDYSRTEGSSYFQRECLLAEGTVFECMLESLKDH